MRDNAHHYKDIHTSPFHLHDGFEENVLPSEPMTLQKTLDFIQQTFSPLPR
jgi:Family of unknown function (DUF6516)